MVSSYSRLGFTLHNYLKVFLYLNLKTKFLKWYAEGVINTWKRVRLYVYKERFDKPERSEVGQEFEWLFNEAIKYQERKNMKKLKGNI